MVALLVILISIIGYAVLNGQLQGERRRRWIAERQRDEVHRSMHDFIASYRPSAKPSQMKLLDRMTEDLTAGRDGRMQQAESEAEAVKAAPVGLPMPLPDALHRAPAEVGSAARRNDVDSELVLLYFGAFLFVAAAGLFVWLGGAPGVVKSLVVMIVTAVLFCGGVWLFRHRVKLRLAGQAFAGIGIAIAPLIGVSVYTYVLGQRHGYAVWLVTSVLCLAMYVYAYRVFRTSLMAYVLILTLLSMFESAVGIAGLPVYVFGWGLAVVAIGLRMAVVSGALNDDGVARDSGLRSANYFVPGALAVGLLTVPSLGAGQFGVSMMLASFYYAVGLVSQTGWQRRADALLAQVSGTLGVPVYIFGISGEADVAIVVAVAIVLVQALYVAVRGRDTQLWRQSVYVLLAAISLTAVLALISPVLALGAVAATVVVGLLTWLRLGLSVGYGLATVAFALMPFVYGQLVVDDIGGERQALLSLMALAVLAVGHIAYHGRVQATHWHTASVVGLGLSIAGTVLSSLYAGPLFCLGVSALVVVVMLALAAREHTSEWVEPVVIVAFMPILRSVGDESSLFVSTLATLLGVSLITLRFRSAALRWMSAALWLLLPWSLGMSGFAGEWSSGTYAWSYVVTMVALVILRAVALGRIFASDKVRIVTMLRNASVAYVAGYVSAAVIAMCLAGFGDTGRWYGPLVIASVMVVAVVTAYAVERRRSLYAVQPLLAQILLLTVIQPVEGSAAMTANILVSSALAASVFFMMQWQDRESTLPAPLIVAGLLSGLFAPASVLFVPAIWPMAVGLVVFGVMLFEYAAHRLQSDREWSVGVIALGLLWLVYLAGVREVQVFTHVAVAVFGLLAYWRHVRGDRAVSESYIRILLGVATLPLVMQALVGGEPYGMLLLLQQVAIMVAGVLVRKSFMVRWGLYVSVASVLYQLRDLGYAALAFLALFVIGLAVYRLQKSDKRPKS